MIASLSRLRVSKPLSLASALLLILVLSFATRAFIGQFMLHHSHLNVTVSLSYVQDNALLTYAVQFLGMLQGVLASFCLALIVGGVLLAFRKEWRTSGLLLATTIYYLVMNSIMHIEHRYNLPMHAFLLVFAGFAIQRLGEILSELFLKYRAPRPLL